MHAYCKLRNSKRHDISSQPDFFRMNWFDLTRNESKLTACQGSHVQFRVFRVITHAGFCRWITLGIGHTIGVSSTWCRNLTHWGETNKQTKNLLPKQANIWPFNWWLSQAVINKTIKESINRSFTQMASWVMKKMNTSSCSCLIRKSFCWIADYCSFSNVLS